MSDHPDERTAPASNRLDLKWYREGLRFSCTRCGNCCAGHGAVWLSAEDLDRLAVGLGMSRDDFARRYVRRVDDRLGLIDRGPHGDCVFLGDDRGCRVYEHRPLQCRTWPFWPSNLVNRRAWDGASVRCPGINRGESYTGEEIERVAEVQRNSGVDD